MSVFSFLPGRSSQVSGRQSLMRLVTNKVNMNQFHVWNFLCMGAGESLFSCLDSACHPVANLGIKMLQICLSRANMGVFPSCTGYCSIQTLNNHWVKFNSPFSLVLLLICSSNFLHLLTMPDHHASSPQSRTWTHVPVVCFVTSLLRRNYFAKHHGFMTIIMAAMDQWAI